MVLPHENKPVRFPVVPACHTALLETMTDGTVPVTDGSSRKAFLCRDPAYPLWMERYCTKVSAFIEARGSAASWWVESKTNSSLLIPRWDSIDAVSNTGSVDDVSATQALLCDYAVMGNATGTQAFYIPPNSSFGIRLYTGAAGGGSGIEFEFGHYQGGEEYTSTMLAASTTDGFFFVAIAGTSIPANKGEGTVPVGFCWLKAMRTTVSAPTAALNPILQVGWCTGGTLNTPTGSCMCMLPYAMPPEFNNSVIPYARSRANATAALFTNVTAALSKEGTILAARLKPAVIDPWSFTTSHLNSVHPALRYFGPLEKGLYTFTTPNGNVENFEDCVITMGSQSSYNDSARPLFNFYDIGIYNAITFSDLGSSSAGTQLAVSAYAHIEFETTSSLFNIGVSSQPLELLHSTEVALLKFGHFHENPIHWGVLATAVRHAVAALAPIAAPYVQKAASYLIDRGVERLTGRTKGDRRMPQKQMVDPPPTRNKKQKPKHVRRKPKK